LFFSGGGGVARKNNDTGAGVLSNYDFEKPVKSVARIVPVLRKPEKNELSNRGMSKRTAIVDELFSASTIH